MIGRPQRNGAELIKGIKKSRGRKRKTKERLVRENKRIKYIYIVITENSQ